MATRAEAQPLAECLTKQRVNSKYDCVQTSVDGAFRYSWDGGGQYGSWDQVETQIRSFIASNARLCSGIGFAWGVETSNAPPYPETLTTRPFGATFDVMTYDPLINDFSCRVPVGASQSGQGSRQRERVCQQGWEGPYLDTDNVYRCRRLSLCREAKCDRWGNPVLGLTGAKYQEEVDYEGEGPAPLRLTRHYLSTGFADPSTNLSIGRVLPMGYVWMHGYERGLVVTNVAGANHTVVLRRPQPAPAYFYFDGTSYTSAVDARDRLARRLDGGGAQIGWTLTTENGAVEIYDALGRLVELRERDVLRATLQYDAQGLLATVTDPFGRTLTFTHDALGQVSAVTLPDATQVVYARTRLTTPPAGTGPDATGAEPLNRLRIDSVTYPGGAVRTYHHMEPAFAPTDPAYAFWTLLTGITDETGTRTANFTYDAATTYYLKVTTEGAGGVGRFQVSPGESNTLVIGPLGTRYSTSRMPVLGAPRIAGRQRCNALNANCSSLFSIDYNANGNVATYSDARGFSTGYAYDAARNLEVRRTEAVGTPAARTILTSWHPVWPIPTEIKVHSGGVDAGGAPTGPLLKRTTFTYDASGNLTARSEIDTSAAPTTRTWAWTYATFGRVLTETDPNGRVTTYTYHPDADPVVGKRGNRATMTNPAGHLTQYTAYDANARPTNVIDPNGLSTTLSYHPRGWLTSATVSDGTSSRSTTIEYWGNGKVKQVTQPDASFLAMGYDAAQRLTSVTDNLGNSVTYTLDAAGNRIDEQMKDTSATLRQRVTRVFDTLDRLQSVTGALR